MICATVPKLYYTLYACDIWDGAVYVQLHLNCTTNCTSVTYVIVHFMCNCTYTVPRSVHTGYMVWCTLCVIAPKLYHKLYKCMVWHWLLNYQYKRAISHHVHVCLAVLRYVSLLSATAFSYIALLRVVNCEKNILMRQCITDVCTRSRCVCMDVCFDFYICVQRSFIWMKCTMMKYWWDSVHLEGFKYGCILWNNAATGSPRLLSL